MFNFILTVILIIKNDSEVHGFEVRKANLAYIYSEFYMKYTSRLSNTIINNDLYVNVNTFIKLDFTLKKKNPDLKYEKKKK